MYLSTYRVIFVASAAVGAVVFLFAIASRLSFSATGYLIGAAVAGVHVLYLAWYWQRLLDRLDDFDGSVPMSIIFDIDLVDDRPPEDPEPWEPVFSPVAHRCQACGREWSGQLGSSCPHCGEPAAEVGGAPTEALSAP